MACLGVALQLLRIGRGAGTWQCYGPGNRGQSCRQTCRRRAWEAVQACEAWRAARSRRGRTLSQASCPCPTAAAEAHESRERQACAACKAHRSSSSKSKRLSCS